MNLREQLTAIAEEHGISAFVFTHISVGDDGKMGTKSVVGERYGINRDFHCLLEKTISDIFIMWLAACGVLSVGNGVFEGEDTNGR